MDILARLNEELEQNRERRRAIREKNPAPVLPKAEREEFETLTKRGETLHNLIEVEKQKIYDKALDDEKAYAEEPVYKIPRAVSFSGGDDATAIKQLSASGWDLKDGTWYAPIAGGKQYPMYPAEVLIGPVPGDDPIASNFVKQTRRVMEPDYREAWMKWYKMATLYRSESMAMSLLAAAEQKALSEGLDAAGGFTVPPDVQASIGGRIAQTSVMMRLGSVAQTMRDQWSRPMVAPNSTAANRNIFADDFVAAWVGETPNQASIDVQFEMFDIAIKKLRAFTLVSNDLIADSVGNMISDLTQRGARSIALQEDNGFIAGLGVPLEPLGILSHPLALTLTSNNGMAVDVEGTTANTISNSTTNAGSFPLIKAMAYQLPSQYAANATWIMRRVIQGDIAALVDANGRPIWNSYLESGLGRPQAIIEGFPVENSEFVGNDGAVSVGPSTIPLILGDISAYQIVVRNQLTVRVLTERFGDTDQTGIFLFVRVGGGLWNYDAIRTGIIAA